MRVIKWIGRFLAKLMGVPSFALLLRQRYYKESPTKRTMRIKGGAIIVSNHVHIMDFFTIWFAHPFRKMRFFISEAVYRYPFLGFMCKMVDSILVHRERSDMSWMAEAEKTLNKNGIVTIFPEGKIGKAGQLNPYQPAAIYLALRTGKPIIPHYIEPNYFKWKRARIIMGEPIYIQDYCDTKNPGSEKVKELCDMLRKKTMELKRKMTLYRKYGTRNTILFKAWFLDLAKAFLWLPTKIVFPSSFHYVDGATRKDRKPVGRSIIVSKHWWFNDGPILDVHYMSRRVRVVVAEDMYVHNKWLFRHLLSISYDRNTASSDPKCFLEIINVLKAEGCVAIYPEGHVQKYNDGKFNQGAAYFSLVTGSPVHFYFMMKQFKPFHHNHIMIGKTIKPQDYFTSEEMKDKATIERWNEIIKTKFYELESAGQKYIKKHKK